MRELTRDELWEEYIKKNPHWLDTNMTFSPEGLRMLFERVFERGRRFGAASPTGDPARPEPERPQDGNS